MNFKRLLSKKLYNKYGKDITNQFNKMKINNILKTKPTHLVACLKDIMIYEFPEEFFKRYYFINESKKHIPKFVGYYHNYLQFFCKPIFRNLKLGKLLLVAGEKCAENYYNKNYGEDIVNENNIKIEYNSSIKNIFSDTVIESINGVCSFSDSTNSKSIDLNQSSFRFKKIYDNESESLVNILNNLNGNQNKLTNNLNNHYKKSFKIKINEETRKKIMNKVLSNKIKINQIKSPLLIENKKIQNLNNKIINNKKENNINISNSLKKENQNTRNSNNLLFSKTDLSNNAKTNNNYLFTSPVKNLNYDNSLPKVSINSVKHSLNVHISNFFNPKLKISPNQSKKNKTNTISIDVSDNKNKLNNQFMTISNFKQKINLKKRNTNIYKMNSLNRLNKRSSRNSELQKLMKTTYNKFDIQQQLLNNGKNHRLMASCNISTRNKTQNFSPNIQNPLLEQNITLCHKIERKNNRLYLKLSINKNNKKFNNF